MESSYFPRPEFQEGLGRFVLLRIDATGTPEEQEAYERYTGGTALPVYAVLESDGTQVARTGWTGGTDPGGVLLAWMDRHAVPASSE